ncbi:ribosome biogenesis/translation initiation ATPase RLI [archaeon]|jgi:ATP-binding cassette, sub-family E, member 1|nr:ribosome biogenesis/translation initiation ATPase RLI [archaeon]MBT3577736.1 ribosome biogenesis/translation initiation ATPase RLI [archaeon]MBT6820743.1 ribosome biogenesis/translation initiation ATPase RLI [archaeon]MBT6956420.1 ribosome biogenesis/translation initiation ATPase RLI [archaeon]MBT7025883.1 ribosome biogenesis/translation initiation ATPase RLI [archaeon]
MKLAVIHKEKCKPAACGRECKKYCPVEKKELDSCVTIGVAASSIPSKMGTGVPSSSGKAKIDEHTCVGCAICVKRCPFGAIDIINLPAVSESDLIFRYGENGFALYGLPTPKKGSVLGLLGRNGIGKSTAVKILAGTDKINLGKEEASDEDIKKFFKGNELLRYFENLDKKKISYKPQNLSSLSVGIKVRDLLKKRGSEKEINELAKKLGVTQVLDNKMNKLSGGELQRVAIIAAALGEADIYFFDEPLAFLDIGERLRVSDFISEIAKTGKTVVVVEHDLLILDYLSEYLNIFFGGQGAFGTVSGVKASKNGVNAYLNGFLREENLRIRDKPLNFNFTKNPPMSGAKIAEWPDFKMEFGPTGDDPAGPSGFKLDVKGGEIHQNHVIGVLGKNGTGKTTFVRALAGELKTSEGKLDLKLDVSYKPQYLFTDSEEVVRDIMFKEKIGKKMASVFNLGVLAAKKVKELSGGELQRFSIARCLAKDADVYLIDEPSAYLDVEERISVAKAIKEMMVEKEKTAFVVDHDLLLVSYLADSIVNFGGESGVKGEASEIRGFEEGISELLKSLDITLRKDKESGRPRINKLGSVLDREQKGKGKWAVF